MKLSTEEKVRRQRLLLFGIAFVGLAYAMVALVIRPLVDTHARLADETQRLNNEILAAEQTLSREPSVAAREAIEQGQLDRLTNACVVFRVLGSYPVQRIVHRLAQGTGFEVLAVRELGKQSVPRQPPKLVSPAPASYASYLVEVSGVASYADVLELVGRLESENPLIGVLMLDVIGQPEVPERHRVLLRLEWPVEADPPPSEPSDVSKRGRPLRRRAAETSSGQPAAKPPATRPAPTGGGANAR